MYVENTAGLPGDSIATKQAFKLKKGEKDPSIDSAKGVVTWEKCEKKWNEGIDEDAILTKDKTSIMADVKSMWDKYNVCKQFFKQGAMGSSAMAGSETDEAWQACAARWKAFNGNKAAPKNDDVTAYWNKYHLCKPIELPNKAMSQYSDKAPFPVRSKVVDSFRGHPSTWLSCWSKWTLLMQGGSFPDGKGNFTADAFSKGMASVKKYFDGTFKTKTKMGTCIGASKDAAYVDLHAEPRTPADKTPSPEKCSGDWLHTVAAINEMATNGTSSPNEAQIKQDYEMGGKTCAPYTQVAAALQELTGSKGLPPPGSKAETNPGPKTTSADYALQQLSIEFGNLEAK